MRSSMHRAIAWLWIAVSSLTLSGCFDSDDTKVASFTQQPVSTTVAEGASATFTVAVAPAGTPLQWFRNGVAIAGATSTSYTLPAVTAADNGANFYAVATLDFPAGSRSVTLTVTPAPPRITTAPAAATVVAPASATFTVVAAGSGLAYQWQRGTTDIAGATTASYTTPATTLAADNGATFRVVVTNAGGSVTSPPATLTVNAPAPPPPPSSSIVPAVEAGGEFNAFTVALRANGTVWAWGANGDGALGNGTTTSSIVPAQVGGLPQVKQIAAGGGHVVALGVDGSVWTWGRNGFGQIGDGTNTNRLAPFRVTLPTTAAAVAGGTVHTLVVLTDGRVYSWGSNAEGQLGDGTVVTRNSPVQVSGLTNAVEVAAGIFHSIARTTTGQVFTWGFSPNGQLGLGAGTSSVRTPTQITSLANAVSVGAGSQNGAAILQGGQLYTWGVDNVGQLGNGAPNANSSIPVLVTGTFDQVPRGNTAAHMVGRLSGGTVVAWGFNDRGQLGIGTTTNAAAPAAVSLANVTWVTAGAGHSAAVRTDGTVYVWGSNSQGQLGLAGGNQNAPTLLPGFNLLTP